MITKRRKLRTSEPLWLHQRAPRVSTQSLQRDLKTEVLIVGGGITGAMIGEALTEAGLETVIVDRRAPTKGATAASTALVQYELDIPIVELEKKIGSANATRAWRRSRLAVTSLEAFFKERGVDAQSRDSLYLAGNQLGPVDLRREAGLRQHAGLETLYLSRPALRERFGIDRAAALLSFQNLAINPRAAAAQLLIRAKKLGARLYAPVDIVEIAQRRSFVEAISRDGVRIRCKHVVLASGYEFPKMVPTKGHRIKTTWAIATRPQRRHLWPEECLIWEAAEPYLYMRTTTDGRVICGGEDSQTSNDVTDADLMARKIARLQRKLGRLFPRLDVTAEFAWAASFGETSTGLPLIGAIPRHKNCWAAFGYGGNGITYSRIAAEILRTALTGGHDPDADLYDFKKG